MRISIGDEQVDVPNDLAGALLAGLKRERPIQPPETPDFDDLVDLVARVSHLTQHLTVFKELVMARADSAGAYSNRRALALAAAMSASQLGRVLEGHGLPKDRRTGGVDLVVAFRTADNGVLYLAEESDVEGLRSFSLPSDFASEEAPGEFAGRELTFYYRPQVPLAVASLGRTAGFTVRHAEQGLIACVTEDVFDALFGDPRIDPTRPNGR